MSFAQAWKATEACLEHEADSLGELLVRLRSRISPLLIGEPEWQKVVERARDLPVTLGAFPFGFELPLHDQRRGADFGVSVVGGSRSAADFEARARLEGAGPCDKGIAWFLQETKPKDSALRRIAGSKMLLEYDLDSSGQGIHPDPGIFLYPLEDTLVGDRSRERARDLGVVLEAVSQVSGMDFKGSDRRDVERVYMAMQPNTAMRALGAFPSRGGGVRLAITGFKRAQEVTSFLDRAHWPGQHAIVTSTVSRYEQRGAFGYLGIHLDVGPNGLSPALGISFYAQEGEWLKDIRHWAAIIEGLGEDRIAVEDKLSALTATWCGVETLFGKSAPFVVVRGIHHFKLAVIGDRIEQVKAYPFFLMLGSLLKGRGS